MKSHNELKMHIKTAETYTQEKFDYMKTLVMKVDGKAGKMANTDMIDAIKEDMKNVKLKFEMEFEQFQQYLKD